MLKDWHWEILLSGRLCALLRMWPDFESCATWECHGIGVDPSTVVSLIVFNKRMKMLILEQCSCTYMSLQLRGKNKDGG